MESGFFHPSPGKLTTMATTRSTESQGSCLETRVATQAHRLDSGMLIESIAHPAFLGAWDEDGVVHLYWDPTRWTDDLPARLRDVLRTLGASDATLTIHELPGQDWNAQWAASVEPIRIGRRVVIRPTWKTVDRAEGDVELIIDPKQAFGTGHHATTQLLVERMETLIAGGERLLDVGTGSGILAMIALHLGASSALGVDHDPTALACAREYAALNGFGRELGLRCGTLHDLASAPFEIIVANLDCRTILSLYEQFYQFAHETTALLLSGILLDDRAEIIRAGAGHGWEPVGSSEREGWLAIELRRVRQGSKTNPPAPPDTRSARDT